MKATRARAIPRPEAGTEPAPVVQIREAAQALLSEGRTEEAFEYFLAALAAVLRKNTELELVVSKYVDHTPLHRLHRIYERSGVEIPVSTLADWVAGVADRIVPLVDVLSARMLRAYVVQTDATV